MADTLQIVRWSLERTCALRQGAAVSDPAEALRETASLRTFAHCREKKYDGCSVVGDVCVTSYTSATLPGGAKGPRPPYPYSGFVLSERFDRYGGANRLLEMCSECPVNLSPDQPAECCGTLFQRPNSEETDQQLKSIANRLGLESAVLVSFPRTEPWWYGFWIESPVSRDAAGLLHVLFDAMADEDSRETSWSQSQLNNDLKELRAFARAAERAANGGATLHVSLAPPGHTDFGFYTVFAHCPRCKAAANVPRWTRDQPTALHRCSVCGTAFSPAETASSRRETYDLDELRTILGQERFERLALDYLIERGTSPGDAAEIVAATEQAERERQAKAERTRLLNERKRAWVESVLYAGLTVHHVKHEGDEDDGPGMAMFSATDILEVLRRARERKLTTLMLVHHSKSGKHDKYADKGLADPTTTVEKWRAEGCNEFFAATFRIPDELAQ
jgi:hypothetical protein